MQVPTIHLNGTPASHLAQEVEDAYAAVNAAIDALAKMTVNGRDYYPQGPDAFELANREHADRIARLRSVANELEEYACSLPI